MKDRWLGIKDGDSVVGGDGAFDANGVSFEVEGELRRRPGLLKLFALGGRALGTFRSAIAGTWVVLADANGTLKAVNLATPTTSTTLKSGYGTGVVPCFSYANGRLYVTNNFDRVQVWNGIAATIADAGIAAPAAAPGAPTATNGSATVGTHLIRYRYLDNTSPASTYRSNVSGLLSQSVTTAANARLTFSIGSSATNIIRSTDSKATTIQLEATAAAGSVFYVVTSVNNATVTSVVMNIADATLVLGQLGGAYDSGNSLTTDDLGTGNEQPPLGAVIAQCRDYVFLGVDEPYALSSLGVTNGLATISGTGFSTLWNERKVIRIGTDATAYQIASATATVITLVNIYAGSTDAAATGSVFSQDPNAVYWSAFIGNRGAVLPESFRAGVRSRSVLNGTGDQLRGFCEFNGDLMIFGRFTTQRLVFVDDPGSGEIDNLSGQFGLWNQRCLIKVEGVLYGWGPNGVWTAQGGMPRWISRDIESTYQAIFDPANARDFHGSYDPQTKSIRWHYVNIDEGEVRDTIAYDIPGQRWVREKYRQGISASITGTDTDGQLQCILSDNSNAMTYVRKGVTDGVPSSSTGAYTVASSSTTTVTNVTDSLPTGTLTDLAKLIIYDPVSGEQRVIASNTASAITHAAFTAALTQGANVYVGAIPWSYETNWWVGDGLEEAKRPCLFVEVFPGTVTGIARVTLYADWTATAVTFTGESTYQPPLGVSAFTSGQAYLEINFGNVSFTDGLIKLPMPMDWRRAVRAKLEVISPAGTVRIRDMYFALQAKRDSMPKTVQA